MTDSLLEEIKAAYQTLKPIRRCFFLHERGIDYGCVVVALAVHRGVTDKRDPALVKDEAENTCLEWASSVFGEDFVWGVISAWDGEKQVKDEPDFLAGYTIGLEAAKQLLPREPPA